MRVPAALSTEIDLSPDKPTNSFQDDVALRHISDWLYEQCYFDNKLTTVMHDLLVATLVNCILYVLEKEMFTLSDPFSTKEKRNRDCILVIQ